MKDVREIEVPAGTPQTEIKHRIDSREKLLEVGDPQLYMIWKKITLEAALILTWVSMAGSVIVILQDNYLAFLLLFTPAMIFWTLHIAGEKQGRFNRFWNAVFRLIGSEQTIPIEILTEEYDTLIEKGEI